MSVLGALSVGAAVGVVVGWVAARRHGRRAATRVSGEVPAKPQQPRIPGLDLTIEPTFDTLLGLLVNQAAAKVDLPCAVAVREQDGAPIRIRAVSSGGDPRSEGAEVDPESTGYRVVSENLAIVGDPNRPLLGVAAGDRRRGPNGGVCVPVTAGPRAFGVLFAFGEPAMGGAECVALLEPLARAFGPFIRPAMEVEAARRKAETDSLTELPNRRAFERALRKQSGGPVALIALDIDHFKKVNDSLGHAAGDVALCHLSRLLRGALRDGDLAARVGGEEFSVLLPGADLHLAMEVAERLRALAEAKPFRAAGGEHRFTISCGVSATPYPIANPDNLNSTADAALYRAKRAGRNCVVAAGQNAGVGPPEGAGT